MVCTCLGTSTTPGTWLVCKLKNVPHSVALHLRETLDAKFVFFSIKGCPGLLDSLKLRAFSHLKMGGCPSGKRRFRNFRTWKLAFLGAIYVCFREGTLHLFWMHYVASSGPSGPGVSYPEILSPPKIRPNIP